MKKAAAIMIGVILLVISSFSVYGETPEISGTESTEDESGSLDGILDNLKTETSEEGENSFLVSAYGTESTKTSVYTFLNPEDFSDGSLEVKLVQSGTDEASRDDSGRIETDYQAPESYSDFLSHGHLTVRYFFLIDRSTSMPAYSEDVKAFIRAIVKRDDHNGIDGVYDIAGCGKKMEMIKSDLTDAEAVVSTLETMDYDEQETDLYSGVVNAVKRINKQPLQPGSLTNLILITDGVPFVEGEDDEKALAEKALKKIQGNPETVVHTLCLGKWNGGAEEYLCAGTGLQQELGLVGSDSEKAAAAGEKVSDFIKGLSLCVFETEAQSAGREIELHLEYQYAKKVGESQYTSKATGSSNTLKSVRFMEISANGQAVSAKKDSGGSTAADDSSGAAASASEGTEEGRQEDLSSPDESDESAASETGATMEEELSSETDLAGIIAGTEEENKDPEPATPTDSGNDTGSDKDGDGGKGGFTGYILGGLAVLAALAAAVFLLGKKKTGKKAEAAGPVPEPAPDKARKSGIMMRVEIVKGVRALMNDTCYLQKELVIGSDPKQSDIIVSGSGISPRHARIFQRDGMICIEDLGSEQGTFCGGKRLISSNRLRSGDRIRTGEAEFIIWF